MRPVCIFKMPPVCRRFAPAVWLATSLLPAQPVNAAEIDSVTTRYVVLDDASAALNQLINERLAEGVAKANLLDRANQFDLLPDSVCNRNTLYTELRKAIFQSLTASWGLKGYSLDLQLREHLKSQAYHLSLNDSIYRDLDYLEAFSLNLKKLSDVVHIDDHLIGVDKFGHFFAEGWSYFEMTALQNRSLEDAMSWGMQQEQGKFGYATTGIFSFADLTANFNGWRFWNRVLLEEKDPLQGFFANLLQQPYVSCSLQVVESLQQRQPVYAWSLNRAFDIADYVDGAWDEGQNCNSYADPVIEQKITLRIQAVDPQLHCPLAARECIRARQHYGDFSRQLLHPACLTAR